MTMSCGDIKSGTTRGVVLQCHISYKSTNFRFNPRREREAKYMFCKVGLGRNIFFGMDHDLEGRIDSDQP